MVILESRCEPRKFEWQKYIGNGISPGESCDFLIAQEFFCRCHMTLIAETRRIQKMKGFSAMFSFASKIGCYPFSRFDAREIRVFIEHLALRHDLIPV